MENIPRNIFGRTIRCECGRTHTIEPREIIYRADAVERLPWACAGALFRTNAEHSVAVLSDARTRLVAGRQAAMVLRDNGWDVREVLVPDPAPGLSPVCDDVTKQELSSLLESPQLILSVGSGVISDLGKWTAFEMGVPFVCFATAASMNGYASANVAPSLKGVKSLLRACPPDTVIASPSILREAPYELTAAGLGDVLAKPTSSTDWRMNHLLFGDYYCPMSVALICEIEPLYLEHPEEIRAREPAATEALFNALLLSGAAMTMAGTSAPASGAEHAISHTLDMMSSVDASPHDLHGRQVGAGTILAAELYRRVLAIESPEFREPTLGVDAAFWGPLADPVAGAYAEKLQRLQVVGEKLSVGQAWDDLRTNLAPMLASPEKIRDCLSRAGAAYRAQDIGCSRSRLLEAFHHAHEIRARFTVLDLARSVGLLPDAAGEIVDEWAL